MGLAPREKVAYSASVLGGTAGSLAIRSAARHFFAGRVLNRQGAEDFMSVAAVWCPSPSCRCGNVQEKFATLRERRYSRLQTRYSATTIECTSSRGSVTSTPLSVRVSGKARCPGSSKALAIFG